MPFRQLRDIINILFRDNTQNKGVCMHVAHAKDFLTVEIIENSKFETNHIMG